MLWEAAWGPKVELVLRQSEFAVISCANMLVFLSKGPGWSEASSSHHSLTVQRIDRYVGLPNQIQIER